MVVGSLSFMSDRLNLFTDDTSGVPGSTGNSYSAKAGLTMVSLSSGVNNASVFDQANPTVSVPGYDEKLTAKVVNAD